MFLMSIEALRLRQKASQTLLLMRNASIVIRRDIGSLTVRNNWRRRRRRRRRREVRLPLQV
jgi:hypothetical protein